MEIQKSAIIFFTNPNSNNQTGLSCRHSNELVKTYKSAAYSVIVALTEYLVQNFPNLPCPGQQNIPIEHGPKFPNLPNLPILHNMYDAWSRLICDAVQKNDAIRAGEDCYYRVEVTPEYGLLLEKQGFSKIPFQGRFEWGIISHQLSQIQNSFEQNQKQLIIICNCSDFDYRHIFYGEYFNNQHWKQLWILNDQFPSQEDYSRAKAIIVPGSDIRVSQKNPQVDRFGAQMLAAMSREKFCFLGFCFGIQFINMLLGGECGDSGRLQSYVQTLRLHQKMQELTSLKHQWAKEFLDYPSHRLWKNHSDEIKVLPPSLECLYSGQQIQHEVIASKDGRILAFQGHPETTAARFYMNRTKDTYLADKSKLEELQKIVETNIKEYDDNGLVFRKAISKFLGSY